MRPNRRFQIFMRFVAYFYAACLVAIPVAMSAQGPKCTVTVVTTQPSSGSLCAGIQFAVSIVEKSGPHPGRNYDLGSTNTLYGVCAFSYPPCNPLQDESTVTLSEAAPTITSTNASVSASGAITVTVYASEPTAQKASNSCLCTDNDPNGYLSVTPSAPRIPSPEYFNGNF
jgi:hypothetical protein